MKRFVLSAIAAGLLHSFAFAQEPMEEYLPFIGLEIGSVKASLGYTINNQERTDDTDHEAIWGIKGGFVNQNSRIYASFHYSSADSVDAWKEKVYDGSINLEAMSEPYKLTKKLATIFFVGGHAGAIRVDTSYDPYKIDDEQTDFIYGFQGGINIAFDSKVNLEFAGRYSWTELDYNQQNWSFEVNHYYNIYAGINYNF